MPVLLIAALDVHDPEGFKEYVRLAAPTLEPHNARVLAIDDATRTVEGDWPGARTVVLEFPTEDAARAWYDSADYQQAAQARFASATTQMVLVDTLG